MLNKKCSLHNKKQHIYISYILDYIKYFDLKKIYICNMKFYKYIFYE